MSFNHAIQARQEDLSGVRDRRRFAGELPPLADAPESQLLDAPDTAVRDTRTIRCQFCSGKTFRRSRLRGRDLAMLAILRYPVRCQRCHQKQYVSFSIASIALPARSKHSRKSKDTVEWKEWTETDANDPVRRPASLKRPTVKSRQSERRSDSSIRLIENEPVLRDDVPITAPAPAPQVAPTPQVRIGRDEIW